MANPKTPAQASFPVPPPVPGWPLVDAKGMATPAFAQFLQLLWAAIQGTGGIIDITTQNIFEESPSFSPDTVAGKQPILAEMPESRAVPRDKTWLLAERSYADLYKRVSNAEVLAALGSVSSSKVADIKGTANQVIVSTAAGIYTLSTPQSIATTSTVQFGGVGIGRVPVTILDILQTQAGQSSVRITNADTAGSAAWVGQADTSDIFIVALGSAFGGTLFGGLTGNSQVVIEADAASSLYIGSNSAIPIIIAPNRHEKVRIDGTRMTLSEPVQLRAYTVATLPTGAAGDVAYVTDATAPTFLGVLVGGGAVNTPVFYNGAAWVSF